MVNQVGEQLLRIFHGFVVGCADEEVQRQKSGIRVVGDTATTSSAHDYTTEPDAEMTRPERHFLAVKPYTLKPLIGKLHHYSHRHSP